MAGDVPKHASVRVPIVVFRPDVRGAAWQGWPDLADQQVRERLCAQGPTEAALRRQLTDLVHIALRRAVYRPVLVIGGGPDYADCVHVINPEPHGWVVYAIRGGRDSGSWHSDHDRDELLRQVLDHVGGHPAVIHL